MKLIRLFFLFLFIYQLYIFAAWAKEHISIYPEKPAQGDILSIIVTPNPGLEKIDGTIMGKRVSFYKRGDRYFSFIGIDLDIHPGIYPLTLNMITKKGTRVIRQYRVEIKKAGFGIQRLTLPERMVKFNKETLLRIKKEKQLLHHIWYNSPTLPVWEGNFIMPVHGKISSQFGLRRIINGNPANPHTGLDIAAPEGTPIVASNDGRVILVGNLFFTGNTIILDHGMGLYTVYCHLSSILVHKGDRVKKGEVIGKVGKSGRATGPHLHWGVRLNGARVSPLSLINLPLEVQG